MNTHDNDQLEAEIRAFKEFKNSTERILSSTETAKVQITPMKKKSDPVLTSEVNYALQKFKNRGDEVPQDLVDLLEDKREEVFMQNSDDEGAHIYPTDVQMHNP